MIISNAITHLGLASTRGTDYGYEGLHVGRTSSKERVPEKGRMRGDKKPFLSPASPLARQNYGSDITPTGDRRDVFY